MLVCFIGLDVVLVYIDMLCDLMEQLFSFKVVVCGLQYVFECVNGVYFKFFGDWLVLGLLVCEVLLELLDENFYELLDCVYQIGQIYIECGVCLFLWCEYEIGFEGVVLDFVFQFIKGVDGQVVGIFIEGNDVIECFVVEECLCIVDCVGGIGIFEWFLVFGKLLVLDCFCCLWGLLVEGEVILQ